MNRSTPNVLNSEVTAAQANLNTAGLNVSVVGSGSTVLKQVPEAGKSIPKEGTVYLYTDEESLNTTVTMPDFTGKNLVQARQAAQQAGLNLQLTGGGLDSGEAKASGQDIAYGTAVPKGTVVTVTFIVENNIQ